MKKLLYRVLSLLFVLSASSFYAPFSGVAKNQFAIFVDSQTYDNCGESIHAYQAVLQEEGLMVSIHAQEWISPQQVKDIILSLSKDKKNPLEGVVFIGEVPIVMVRGGQHLTTAFKMNEEKYPKQESSVASDRYYDDFDLEFDFLERDTVDTNRYFYRLNEKGAQTLKPEIYSGRIRVPKFIIEEGHDPYELISKYLYKAVAAHRESNVLDYMTFFYGSGYNSEDMNVWREKIFASYEEFPYTKGRSEQHRFLNFHQEEQMKWTLFSELQRGETDFFQFSEHGSPDTQYINGTPVRRSFSDKLFDIKMAVTSSKRARPYLDSLSNHISPKSLSDSAVAQMRSIDSLASRHKDLYQQEIFALKSNPRVVILNACYNNSFHNPEGYVAGAHIFSDGRCVVAQGNTVNVLQDKYENELVGLLSLGIRVGLWQKEVSYLEAHLAGDPTFRFTPAPEDVKLSKKLYKALISGNSKVWKSLLKSENPIARAAAVVHYSGEDSAEVALEALKSDPSSMVRMTAFSELFQTELLGEALLVAMDDPYELIVRHAVKTACAYGDINPESPVTAKVKHLSEYHPELTRLGYYVQNYERIVAPKGRYLSEAETFSNKELSRNRRIDAVRTFRNNNYLLAIPSLLAVISDGDDDVDVRVVCAEALGWYNLSVSKKEIIASLKALDMSGYPAEVSAEIIKTIKRLENR